MRISDGLATLKGARGAALQAAKARFIDALAPDELAVFLLDAPPTSIRAVAELLRAHGSSVSSERAVALYEATHRSAPPSKSAKTIAFLRARLAWRLGAAAALECLERHPEDETLVNVVRDSGSVAQLRRAAAVGKPFPQTTELLAALEQTPGELGIVSARSLATLGCTWSPPIEPRYPRVYRRRTREHWEGADPEGALAAPSGGGWIVATRASCERRSFHCVLPGPDAEPSTVQWLSGGEVIDVEVEGVRRVLAPLARAAEKGFEISVDLADPAIEPRIFRVNREGARPFGDLLMLCHWLSG